jgi:hypothetical protein
VYPVKYELNLYVLCRKVDRLCDLVVRVPGYRSEMYCVSCEVRTEYIYIYIYIYICVCVLCRRT